MPAVLKPSSRQHTKQLLQKLPQRIRACSIQERTIHARRYRHPEAAVFTPGPRWDEPKERGGETIWEKNARFVIQYELVPEELMGRIFRTLGQEAPQPNVLCGPKALAIYRQQTAQSLRIIEIDWALQKNTARRRLLEYQQLQLGDNEQAWRALLLDPTSCLSDLFRFVLARQEGYADLAEFYRDAALSQYLCDSKQYDQVWGNVIPEELRQAAEKTRLSLGVVGGVRGGV